MEIANGIAHQLIEQRMCFGRGVRRIAADETPEHVAVLGVRGAGKVQQQREADRAARPAAAQPSWMCQTGFISLAAGSSLRIGREMADIFIDGAWDHVEVEPLRLLRALIHVEREALGAGIGEPFLDGQPIAARLGDLLAVLVEEKLVD